jgi:formylglycine-generating enzyme required for sulfatase activity
MTRSRYLVIMLLIGLSIVGTATRAQEEIVPDETIAKQITLEEGSDNPEGMVFVEGGTFQMGNKDGYSVAVSDFFIGRCELTQGEYEAVMGKNPSEFKESGIDAPVEMVTWYDAVEFCNQLSDKEGLDQCYSGSGDNIKCNFNANGYRLPKDAEWEYAARGGNDSRGCKYAGSNDIEKVAEYHGNNNKSTKPVGGKKANELGIYDMSGNVWEWCWDLYGDFSNSGQTNPKGSTSGSDHVGRGGSWLNRASRCRVVLRINSSPGYSGNNIGFRLACNSK